MKLLLKDIKSNPFRDLKLCPLIPAKIEELVSSIQDTGFWKTVIVRKNSKGEYELAFGHHRLAAANKAGLTEADFNVESLSDSMMLKMMSRENSETYKSNPSSIAESYRAVVIGLAEGRIDPSELLPEPTTRKENIRYAPSFLRDRMCGGIPLTYTVSSVARFLGAIGEDRTITDGISAVVNYLENVEMGIWDATVIHTFKTISSLLSASKEAKTKCLRVKFEETSKAAVIAAAGKVVDQNLKAAQEDDKKKKEEASKAAVAAAEETRAARKAEKEAEAIRKAEEAALAEEKRLEAEREWEANKAGREKDARLQKRREEAEARRKDAARASAVKSLIGRIDALMTNEDPMLDRIRDVKKTLTGREKALMLKALGDAGNRFMNYVGKL